VDACSIAWKFVQKHFKTDYRLNALYIPRPGGEPAFQQYAQLRLYKFDFYYDPGGLLMGPCYCSVWVESSTGKIVNYHAADYPLVVSPRPTISVRTAMANSMPYLVTGGRDVALDGLMVSTPEGDERERLLYVVTFNGRGPTEFNVLSFANGHDFDSSLMLMAPLTRSQIATFHSGQNRYTVAVDAHSGEFIGWNFGDLLHGTKISPWPPLEPQPIDRK
jgi:hypothetical protein